MVMDVTLDEYLQTWLARHRAQLEPRTWHGYCKTVELYLSPALGHVPLHELDPLRIEQRYTELFASGRRDGGPLALGTVRLVHAVLHKALADAVRLRMLPTNVADFVQLPRRRTGDEPADAGRIATWTAEEARRFLDLTADHPLSTLWWTALGTGMRRGELLALRWSDLDLEACTLRVTGCAHHRRRTAGAQVDEDRPTADALDRRGARRAPRRPSGARDNRIRREDWPLVFTDYDGGPDRPDAHHPGVPPAGASPARARCIRLHDLRHTHASLLLQAGVSIKVVSERLGHRTIALTMDTYTHVLPAMDADAADRFARLLGGTPSSVPDETP